MAERVTHTRTAPRILEGVQPTDLTRRASVLAALSSVVTGVPRSPRASVPERPLSGVTPARVTYLNGAPVTTTAPPASVDSLYPPTTTVPTATSLAPIGTSDLAVHLARRASWGATPELVAEIRRVGRSAWLDAQLNPLTTVPDTATDSLVASLYPRLSMAIWQVHDTYWPDQTGDLGNDVIQAYMARAIWSKRQLLEVMVDFWTNHLVVTAPWGETWDSAHRYHIDVIRKNALGRYADMLVAAARHPAMLNQLDNGSSTKRAPNENFGRELLELHTVGVDGGYLESDISRSALALTGLSMDQESGEYVYRQVRHHRGALSVLGWSDANASAWGEPVATSYLTYLARHPKTARRIATKLAVRFVSDTPPTTLVYRLAQVYLDNDTRIAPVLKSLLTSTEFDAGVGQKVKRPLENMVSTVRTLGVQPGTDSKGWLGDLSWRAKAAGQQPMGWPAPNGYPDVAGAWAGAGTTLAAWNFHMGQGWESTSTTPRVAYPAFRSLLPTTLPATYGALIDALAVRLLDTPLPAAKRDAVCAFLEKTSATALKSTDAVLGWRLPYVVALVLDSPEFATR